MVGVRFMGFDGHTGDIMYQVCITYTTATFE